MARIATSQRPPIVSALCLFGYAVLLGPRPATVIEPEPLGPRPKCVVAGERDGELYWPDAAWKSQMPVVKPYGRWTTPILPPGPDVIDVDVLVSGLKRLLATPKT